jgi:hypothetical protein
MSFTGASFALAFAAAALLVWGVARPQAKGRVGEARLALAAWLPALLIVACLLTALIEGRFGEFRLTLNAVRADITGQPLRLGGDAERDDIVTPGLDPDLATVEIPEGADAPPRVRATAPRPGRPVQLVAVERAFKRLDILGAVPIGPGDAICLKACDGAVAHWFKLAGSGRLDPARVSGGALETTGRGRSMPRRTTLRLIPGLVFWAPTQAIHPLRDFLPPGEARNETGFLFQDGGLGLGAGGAHWRLVLPGTDGRIRHADGRTEPVRPPLTAALPAKGRLKVVLLEARFYDLPAGETGRRGRLVERRSVQLGLGQGGAVNARLDTPATTVIGTCPRDGEMSAARILTARAAASSTIVSLPALGGLSATTAEGALPLPEPGVCAEFTRGALDRGELSADGRIVQLRLDRFAFPWILLVAAIAWAALSWRLQRRLLADRPVAWAIIFVLQALLAVRALVALSGVAVDTTLVPDRLLADSVAAYIAAPALFLALAPRGKAPWPAWLGLALFVAATVVGVMQAAQRPTGFVLAIVFLAVGAAFYQMLVSWRPQSVPGTSAAALADRLGDLAPTARRWAWVREHAWVAVLATAVLFRILLALAGVKERLFVAVSAVYTPLLIIGFAGMLAAAPRAAPPPVEPMPREPLPWLSWASRRWAWPVGFALLLLLTVVLLPMFVSDTGYALTTLVPLAAIGAWRMGVLSRAELPARRRWAWSAPAAAVVAAYLVVLLAGAFSSLSLNSARIHAAADPAVDDRAALQILAQASSLDDNRARLLQFLAPERLMAAGAASAENLRVLSAHLSDYTAPVLGRGYMRSAPLGAIVAPVHLSDNVSAVHLMSDFGRVSTAAYLALLAALVAACARLTGAEPGAASWRRLTGLLSLTVVFGVAAYVILANLQLTLFTGRNVYLMAAASGSDLLEGLTLFGLAFFGLTGQREPRHG